MNSLCLIFVTLVFACSRVFAVEVPVKADLAIQIEALPPPRPTLENVHYGDHERQVLDFWKAESVQPTPVLFYIHGGGWMIGDKNFVVHPDTMVAADIPRFLAAGISVVSINYRYVTQAMLAGVKPPVSWPLQDAARALQFVRSKAVEWNLDKIRIGATGTSSGACSALWLALHVNLAKSASSDPIARESTRLWCVAVLNAQTSLDPQQMIEWTPNSRYGGHAFGFMDPYDNSTRDEHFPEFLAARNKLMPWILEYSPYAQVSADDPPIYLIYSWAPSLGQEQQNPTHSANFGVKLQEKLHGMGVECELVYPGGADVNHASMQDFLIEKLKVPVNAVPRIQLPINSPP